MKEQNYDFRRRHWEYHRKGMRNPERKPTDNEVMLNFAGGRGGAGSNRYEGFPRLPGGESGAVYCH